MKKLVLVFVFFTSLSPFAQSPPFPANNDAIIYADSPVYAGHTYQEIVNYACPPASTPAVPDPIGGCTIFATSPNARQDLGALDPGSKRVTIYLGPFTYQIDHVILRKGLRIIGMGATDAGTILQSNNTANFPLFKLAGPTDISPANPASDVYLYGFRLLANSSNTSQSGIFLDATAACNSGLWHSTFEDLYFQGFKGSAILLYGPHDSSFVCPAGQPPFLGINQFLSFRNLWATRGNGGGPDLRIEGFEGQIDCIECHLDGFGQAGDTWANVFIGNIGGGNLTPYSIHFVNLTSQSAHVGVQLQGARHVTFIGSHHEVLDGAYLFTDEGTVRTTAVLISNPFFAGNVGVAAGGYLVNANNAVGITLETPLIDGNAPIAIGTSAGNVNVINPYSNWFTAQLTSTIKGSLAVNGTLSKSAGSFTIDHPLDPDNKYLSHSFVESPDMMNVYNGVATLDRRGTATVKLPAYFEALNRDFRYQLTCMGRFAPVFVSKEVKDNSFRIAGGRPGLKVSWQITGVRHDAYANAHRIAVEQEKKPSEHGHAAVSQ